MSHDISEEELQKFGKGLKFTDSAFTTAKNFSKLENQIRTFAELVTIQLSNLRFSQLTNNCQVIDERFSGVNEDRGADPDILVLDKVTQGRTNCSC